LTIATIAHRDEADHWIIQQLGWRALLDRNSLGRWLANGERHPVAGGCVVLQVIRPTKAQADTSPGPSV
jgi:hypothetical protein